MAYTANLSFLADIEQLKKYTNNSEGDENGFNRRKVNELLESSNFTFPCVSEPWNFCSNIRKSDENYSRLMNFKKGTTTLAFIYSGGIIVAVDSRASMGSFISNSSVKKVIEINDYMVGTMAGGAADCLFWERHLARLCRLHELRNGNRISIDAASNLLANILFYYRAYPLCCGIMIAGWDDNGPKLYFISDGGARLKGRIFSCGSGSTYAYGILDTHYKQDLSTEEAVELGRRAIYHATHRDGGSGGSVRVYHIDNCGWKVVLEEDADYLHSIYAAAKGMAEHEM